MSVPPPSPGDLVADAVSALQAGGLGPVTAAVVLGSGWRPAADLLGETVAEWSYADLPGFVPPGAAGHAGVLREVDAGGRRVLVFLGRTHLYEGHGVDAVAHGVRVACGAGATVVVLTNAAGGIDPAYRVGQPVLVGDHVNLTGRSPLVGARFVDLTDLYAQRLRALALEVDPTLATGVYAALPGPHFETPAEIRMLRTAGADLVGMSTVPEVILARRLGMRVAAISVITNFATGISGGNPTHAETKNIALSGSIGLKRLLRAYLRGREDG